MAPKAVSQVRKLTNTAANRTALPEQVEAIAAGFAKAHKCATAGPDLPPLSWLQAVLVEKPPMHTIYVALAGDNTALGLVVIHNPSAARIMWLVVNESEATFGEVATALCEKVVQYHNAPTWGEVHQPAVRELFLAADPRFSVDDDDLTIRYT